MKIDTTFNHINLDIQFLEDGKSIRVKTDYYFLLNGETLCIPAGFTCDGASIPKCLWPILGSPFVGLHRGGCILHDFLYAIGYKNRKFSDYAMYSVMREDGTGWVKANLIYTGVRMGGWPFFKKEKKNEDV